MRQTFLDCLSGPPEYEACKGVARRFNVPLGAVYQAVSQMSVEDFVDEEGSVVPQDSGAQP